MKLNTVLKFPIVLFAITSLLACKKDEVDNPSPEGAGNIMKNVAFHFKAEANNTADFEGGDIVFQNANGEHFGVTKLRYLVSEIVLHQTDGTKHEINGHHFVDISDGGTLSFEPSEKISPGNYDQIDMVFGLTPENNGSFTHPDLNAISWGWPDQIGGGYHFMQLEGHFVDVNNDTIAYATHLGATINPNNPSDTINNDIHVTMPKNFTVNSADGNVSIDIKMNIDEWYKNPNIVDLNQYGAGIMGNYDAQTTFNENGENGVFSIGEVNSY